jgi:hypothetical protein
MKRCSRCGQQKVATAFHSSKTHRDGLYPWCKDCRRVYRQANRGTEWATEKARRDRDRDHYLQQRRASYQRNRDVLRAKNRRYYQQHKDRLAPARRQRMRESRRTLRLETLTAYGNACACCGETEEAWLLMDHINGDGAEHRRQIGGGSVLYRWLRDHDFPEGFQVLCANCSMAKERPGGCPHQILGTAPTG